MKKNLQNGPDVADLIAKIQEQLTLLDRKVDTIINRLPRPPERTPSQRPFQRPANAHVQSQGRQDNRQRDRVMHRAICADCKKPCEVPFRPSGDRPVYCQECFSRRKAGNSFKANFDNSQKEAVLAQVPNMVKPQFDEKKKFFTKKKYAEKKKSAFKKKKVGK